jgi:hypothetical protein
VKPNTAKGIDVGADGVETTVESDGGIEHGAGGGLQVKLAPTGSGGSGLELSADGLTVAAGRGLNIEDNSVHVELADDPGLEFDGGGEDARLRAKPNTAKGLDRTADGLEVKLQTDGLEFDGDGKVQHKKKSSVRTLHFANDANGGVFGWTDSDNVFHGWYSAMDVPLDTEDEGHVTSASAGS